MNVDTDITPFTKIISERGEELGGADNYTWTTIKKINKNYLRTDHKPKCKHKTIKLLEDKIGKNLEDLGYNGDFFL